MSNGYGCGCQPKCNPCCEPQSNYSHTQVMNKVRGNVN